MKTLQEYKQKFRDIAANLNLQGDSVEVLVQMLSNACFISEVENLSYVQEASLEKATLTNSKIQHCMDVMYSVFRGICPRVILKFKPNMYFSFNMYDEIITSSRFSIYYLGYLSDNGEDFIYAPRIISPDINEDKEYTIIGLISTNMISVKEESRLNQYYIEVDSENLSNDVFVKYNGVPVEVTREFSKHILDNKIFDLTIPSFGSRLYFPNAPINSGNTIEATYFNYTLMKDINSNELSKIILKGAEFVNFDNNWVNDNGYVEFAKGIIVLDQESRDTVESTHYKSNRDRYMNSIIRSNSDIGSLLREVFPNKVLNTSYEFVPNIGNNILRIYYVPGTEVLTNKDREDFIMNREAYYVSHTTEILLGNLYTVNVSIVAELYTNDTDTLESDIQAILNQYNGKFNIDLDNKVNEISSLISKLSNIKSVNEISLIYKDEDGMTTVDKSEIYKNLSKSYFNLKLSFTPIIKQSSI